MKIDPNYAFCMFSFNFYIMSFPIFFFLNDKNTPFFAILHDFVTPKTMYTCTSPGPKNKTLITWIFLRGWYPTSNTSAPVPDYLFHKHITKIITWNYFSIRLFYHLWVQQTSAFISISLWQWVSLYNSVNRLWQSGTGLLTMHEAIKSSQLTVLHRLVVNAISFEGLKVGMPGF